MEKESGWYRSNILNEFQPKLFTANVITWLLNPANPQALENIWKLKNIPVSKTKWLFLEIQQQQKFGKVIAWNKKIQTFLVCWHSDQIQKLDNSRDIKSFFFFIFIPWSASGAFIRVLGTFYGKETSRFCQAQNFEASFLCTAHFITSACSFNIGLALLLGIRSLDPRPRARTAPALAWCRRQLGSQTSCSAKSRSQYWSLTFNDKHWNVWWNLAS